MGALERQLALELLGDERDGGERGSKLMGGGGGKAVERGKPLLARQHHLRGGECRRHLARLVRDAPRIDGREHDAAHDRRPHAADIDLRKLEGLTRHPGQRIMLEGEEGGGGKGHQAQHQRPAHRQRGG